MAFFVEDVAQIRFVVSLVRRVAADLEPTLEIQDKAFNATGGRARVLTELRRFLQDVRGAQDLPDILVIAMDCDCQRRARVAQELGAVVGDLNVARCIVLALPEPHIERWYLADQAALQRITGAPGMPPLPPPRCRKDLFKRALMDSFAAGGLFPSLGGAEYAEDIVTEMDLYEASSNDSSLGAFVTDLRACLHREVAP